MALDAIECQTYPVPIVVLLADDGSTNGVQEPLSEWLAVPRRNKYISQRFDVNHGRKGRVMDAVLHLFPENTEVLVVVDSDTRLEPPSVIRVVQRLWCDHNCAAVCGFVVPADGQDSLLQKFLYFEHIGVLHALKTAQDALGFVPVMAGAFVAHRMSVVKRIGGWSDWLVEDMAWTWKALAYGYRTGYMPNAVAHTHGPTTFDGLFKQRRRWGRGRVEAQRTAWGTRAGRRYLLSALFIQQAASVLLPALLVLPLLAFTLKQWWVLGLMGFCTAASIAAVLVCQHQMPSQMPKGMMNLARCICYNVVFELYLWRPTALGFLDELLGRPKIWMTRQ